MKLWLASHLLKKARSYEEKLVGSSTDEEVQAYA